jgi:hypothetical protein
MKAVKHIFSQPFLLAVSLAALAHSSWSFATLFTGLEPQPQFTGAWFSWIVPGVLLAFSVDIGLLSLANQIRDGKRGLGKLIAFGVLCLAMAFLQFLYIAHHAPNVTLGEGVRTDWIPTVSLIRDASIWVLPSLLPIALCLFAFSETAEKVIEKVADTRTFELSKEVAVVPEQDKLTIGKPETHDEPTPEVNVKSERPLPLTLQQVSQNGKTSHEIEM